MRCCCDEKVRARFDEQLAGGDSRLLINLAALMFVLKALRETICQKLRSSCGNKSSKALLSNNLVQN
jgi:hypothetical protein